MKARYEREVRERSIRLRLTQVSYKERHSRFNITIIPRLPLMQKLIKKPQPKTINLTEKAVNGRNLI